MLSVGLFLHDLNFYDGSSEILIAGMQHARTLQAAIDKQQAWVAKLKGPPDTPYSEGTFLVKLDVPQDYPITPPKCTFLTKIFHPNIHFTTGEICLELFNKIKWTPAWTLESVCKAILDLMRNPNADSPLNCDCGIVK